MDLHDLVSQVAADPERAHAMGFDVDVQREIVRLHSHTEAVDVDLDGIVDEPLYPILDAENAPFSGAQIVAFALRGEFKECRAVVNEDGSLELDPLWPAPLSAAMERSFAALLSRLQAPEN